MRCSSCQRSALDSPRSTSSSSACAVSSCCRARASSTSLASTASSTSAIARSCCTWKKPGPVANSCISPSRSTYTRVEPAFSVAISGACRARTPMSPAAPGTTIISASPSYAGPSGVTSETSNFFRSVTGSRLGDAGGLGLRLARVLRDLGALGRLLLLLLLLRRLAGEPASLLDRVLDRPDHVERLLGQIVVLAVEDLLEALDRVL